MTRVFDWVEGFPQQFVFTTAGKIHDLRGATTLVWSTGWTYLFDRGYFSFELLTTLLKAGSHFGIRIKSSIELRVVERHSIRDFRLPAGMRAIRSDILLHRLILCSFCNECSTCSLISGSLSLSRSVRLCLTAFAVPSEILSR